MKKARSSGKARPSKAGKLIPTQKAAPKKGTVKKVTAKPAAKPAAEAAGKPPKRAAVASLAKRLAAAKKAEALDRPKAGKTAKTKPSRGALLAAAPAASHPQRNADFPNTYIAAISVRLEDPDHPVTLTWAGPNASAQETGPFRSSPGAGLSGLNCDDVATSRRSGSTCTPKGTFTVTGFAPHLNSHAEATNVTWFVPARGIALHYYPTVPKFAASHGCVRIELRRVAQLIQDNAQAGVTTVTVDGTWTKPAHQY